MKSLISEDRKQEQICSDSIQTEEGGKITQSITSSDKKASLIILGYLGVSLTHFIFIHPECMLINANKN